MIKITPQAWQKIGAWSTAILLAGTLGFHFWLGASRLANFAAVDEPYWFYDRVPNFWQGIKEQNWAKTKINDKPGITTAIVSGLGLPSVDPIGFETRRDADPSLDPRPEMRQINIALRLPILLFTTLSLLAFYWLTRRLFSPRIALFFFLFLAFSPLLLGISLIVNPDSLFWVFLPLTILAFLDFQKERDRKFRILAGAFLGLSLLTKYVANILYVFLFGLVFLDYLFHHAEKISARDYFRRAFFDFLILVGMSLATFSVLFPATWVNPKLILSGTILSRAFASTWPFFAVLVGVAVTDIFLFKSRALDWIFKKLSVIDKPLVQAVSLLAFLTVAFVLVSTYTGMKAYNFETILASPKSSFDEGGFFGLVFADLWALLFGISPFALILFTGALAKNIFSRTKLTREQTTVFYLFLFTFLYYAASTVNEIAATTRYQIALYPLAFLVAAIGLDQFLRFRFWEKHDRLISASAAVFLIFALLPSLVRARPFYFAYSSEILPRQYVLNLKDMGDGSYEAAEYLNSLPGAKKLTVWSDKGGVCDFFVGKCLLGLSTEKLTNINIDYYVISAGRKERSTGSAVGRGRAVIKALYAAKHPEHEIVIDRRPNNFVRVISAKILPDEFFPAANFSFAVIGDTQESVPATRNSVLPTIMDNIQKAKPDFAVAVGDLIYYCAGAEQCRDHYRQWRSIVESKVPKLYPAIGNHDYNESSRAVWDEAFTASVPANGPREFGSTVYSFDYQNSHFIVLNSEESPSNFIDPIQYAWLEKDLSETDKPNIFAIFHSPNYPTEEASNPKRDKLIRLLDNYRVAAVFTGHRHLYCYRPIDASRLSGLEGTLQHFIIGNSDSLDHGFPSVPCQEGYKGKHYAIVNIARRHVTVNVYKPDGTLLSSVPFANEYYFNRF